MLKNSATIRFKYKNNPKTNIIQNKIERVERSVNLNLMLKWVQVKYMTWTHFNV